MKINVGNGAGDFHYKQVHTLSQSELTSSLYWLRIGLFCIHEEINKYNFYFNFKLP